jgi:hypothetical protein
MKLFDILLVCSSVLFLQVASDNNAVCWELLYYYYVYKMEWASGVEKTIAVGCAKEFGAMCYFDQFAKYVIEDEWAKVYRPNTENPPDHTKDPDSSAITKLKSNIPSSASYVLNRLSTKLSEVNAMPRVFEAVLDAANAALDEGGVDDDDLMEAITNAQNAKAARAASVFTIQQDVLKNMIGEEAFDLVDFFGTDFDWDQTLENIDDAVDSGQFSQEAGDQIKESIRSFSMSFEDEATATASWDVTHFAIVRSISTSITQLRRAVVDDTSSSGSSSPRAPSPECDDEFISFE